MHSILLTPSDVLFFRDGRPMGGASTGHGAAWPLPTVTNAALHAALHRAEFDGVHRHVPGRSSLARDCSDENRQRRGRVFGDLRTAGPFPVFENGGSRIWYFPRPADADDSARPVLLPSMTIGPSSLPEPCCFPVVSTKPPSKDEPKPWWSRTAWDAYLTPAAPAPAADAFKRDTDFTDTEHTYGIGIDATTGTQDGERFYSASYLRLREGWKLGLFAQATDKDYRHPIHGDDLIRSLFDGDGRHIIVGGQQRVCRAEFADSPVVPLPRCAEFEDKRVKWVLLTPAVWPAIGERSLDGRPMTSHPGGWLPNWIADREQTFEGDIVPAGTVLLLDGLGREKARRKKLAPGRRIAARLIAALVPKPIVVTGWALPHEGADRNQGGAKPTHLAVPAGAVYYFDADSPEEARKLAAALNWHGDVAAGVPPASARSTGQAAAGGTPAATSTFTTIKNRRSTLFGEKGFGLGVCGTWDFHSARP